MNARRMRCTFFGSLQHIYIIVENLFEDDDDDRIEENDKQNIN